MRRDKTKHQLRCFCRGEPMLGTYGVEETGNLYIHVKVYKQQRIYGEIYVTEGRVRVRCRNCLRWHKVVIRAPGHAELEEDQAPVV